MSSNHYIYITKNKINGKKYIGRCSNRYAWDAGYLGSGKWLKMAIKKYGKENFERTVLEEVYGGIHEAVIAEEKWINHYNAKYDKNFYNLSENCGGFDKGDKHTEETKRRISENTSKAMKAKGREYYQNRNNSMKGRAPSNKNKKFQKGTAEYEKTYNKRRKASPKPSVERVEEIKIAWQKYLKSGGISTRYFADNEKISKSTLSKILDGTFQPRRYKTFEELSDKEIVMYENLYYNKNISKKLIINNHPITMKVINKILSNYQSRQCR